DDAAGRVVDMAGHQEAFELHRADLLIEWALRLEHLGRTEEASVRYAHGAEIAGVWVERLAAQGPDAESPWAKALYALALAKLGETDRALELAASIIGPARHQN